MSFYRDLGSLGNFFFVALDPSVTYWANPPFDVIAEVIQQAIKYKVLMYLLVPRWAHRAWWSQVANLPHCRLHPFGQRCSNQECGGPTSLSHSGRLGWWCWIVVLRRAGLAPNIQRPSHDRQHQAMEVGAHLAVQLDG